LAKTGATIASTTKSAAQSATNGVAANRRFGARRWFDTLIAGPPLGRGRPC
jgi:hypothetical protein